MFIILQIFCNAREKKFKNSLLSAAWDVFFQCSLARVNEQNKISFFCNNHKTLSHLKLNLKRRLILVDVRFENWGISLG